MRAQNAPVTITIDAGLNRHTISPLIYGLAYASAAQLSDLNCPLNRSGGNATTAGSCESGGAQFLPRTYGRLRLTRSPSRAS